MNSRGDFHFRPLLATHLLAGLKGARYLPGDKGCDANSLRNTLRQANSVPVIPGRRNRQRKIPYDKQRYKDRHLVENAFCRLKDFPRMATRYHKRARNLLSAVAIETLVAFRVCVSLKLGFKRHLGPPPLIIPPLPPHSVPRYTRRCLKNNHPNLDSFPSSSYLPSAC